jgi:molybdopterin-containing oxidoreductase family iron-sulfur binding subunit
LYRLACVIACHAENNVPVVIKPEVDMHWLRIDRYSSKVPFEGDNQKAEILQ